MSNWGWKEKLERFWVSSVQRLNLAPAEDLAVDPGAANTRIYLPGQGVVVDEPSVIALDIENNEIIAVGQEAKRLARRQPPGIRVAHPIKDGAIADCDAAWRMLSHLISRALKNRGPASLSLLLCVPADITPLDQKAYEDAPGAPAPERLCSSKSLLPPPPALISICARRELV